MVSFENFKFTGGIPIYRQILLFIKRGSVGGTILNGDELPSRRILSALLGINPNTVQKAYRILEEEMLITSQSGVKSFMTLDKVKLDKIRQELLTEDLRMMIHSMKEMSICKEDAIRIIEQYWDDD
jgi:GntR family transcriptional regulator